MGQDQTMKAMVLTQARKPLVLQECRVPEPGAGEIQLKIHACAVCRTDLHVVDGDLLRPKLPLIIGHEIVGRVTRVGDRVARLSVGDRVGVPWLGWTCGQCSYCKAGRENLCEQARFTGYTIDGGYAEFTVADERFCVPIPEMYSDVEATPLLCAGLIGYRSLVRAGEGKRLGIYGFGGAAHIIAQVALYQGRSMYAFTRPGDHRAQQFAMRLGVYWGGGSDERPPDELDAAIIFAPVGALVPLALAAVRKGGTVVRGGRHSSGGRAGLSLRTVVGREDDLLGGQSDAQRRRGVHEDCTESSRAHDDATVCTRTRKRCARPVEKWKARRRRCSYDLRNELIVLSCRSPLGFPDGLSRLECVNFETGDVLRKFAELLGCCR